MTQYANQSDIEALKKRVDVLEGEEKIEAEERTKKDQKKKEK